MDNMETDLRRCVEHIKHVHRELEQLEKEVGSVLDKYEKAKAFNGMQQRREWERETQPAPATPVPKQPVAAVPVQPIPVSTPPTPAPVQPIPVSAPPTPAPVQKEVQVTAENVMQETVKTPVVEVKESVQEVKEPVQEVKEVQVASVPQPENKEKPVKKFDFERTIGKVLMGIFASVLVFVSLLVFAIWAVPKFGDTTKMILMYSISAVISGVGLLLLIKDKTNKWYLSLAGCGMGAFYISFLVTRIHFGVISDLTLYMLFFVWGIAVCLLSRLRSVLFLIIGQIGMLVSTVLGVVYSFQTVEGGIMLGILIYFMIAETIFLASHYKKELYKNIINLTAIMLQIMPLTLGCLIQAEFDLPWSTVTVVVFLLFLFVLELLSVLVFRQENEKDGFLWFFVNFLCVVCAVVLVHCRFEHAGPVVIVILSLLLLVTELVRQWKYRENIKVYVCMDSFIVFLMIIILCEWLGCKNLRVYTGIAPITIITLIYGYFGKRNLYRIAGYVLAALCVVTPMNAYCYLLQGFAVIITLALLQIIKKSTYSTILKMVSYPMFLLFLCIGLGVIWWYKLELDSEWGIYVILLSILSLYNIIFSKIKFLYTSRRTGETEKIFRIETGIIHCLLMSAAVIIIMSARLPVVHAVAVFVAFILFALNTGLIIKHAGATWGTLITCAKTVVLLYFILLSYEQTDILLSILVLLLALIFLLAGFILEYTMHFNMKPTRMMGLVLTILSTLKLLLVDIHIQNKLLLAVNLFVSGMICFAISFLYNILDKMISKKK